ncbi:hypothetical protein [Paenisporosarcina sp.]|uniref:hypothetical protein n=1 Tax=Paenisporosarcina sp. TaxID=1932001 RepID=UPI003C76C234
MVVIIDVHVGIFDVDVGIIGVDVGKASFGVCFIITAHPRLQQNPPNSLISLH